MLRSPVWRGGCSCQQAHTGSDKQRRQQPGLRVRDVCESERGGERDETLTEMARGKKATRKRKLAKKEDEEEVPEKLQREDSATTKLRNAISEAKAAASKEKKKRNYKADAVVLAEFPKAAIYEDYTCMLNQTNIGHNNNKFYIIQVTENKKNSYTCFTRWGRVGEVGQHSLDSHKDVEQAIKAFKKKFKDKTKNDWDKRDDFNAHPGKYTMIDIEDDEEEEADAVDGGQQLVKVTKSYGDCPLDYRTQLMIMIIFSDDMFTNQMSRMNLDIKKMPLGKLSKVQIAKGLEALLDIEAAIKKNEPRDVLMDLSSKFYTHCPHDFGRMVPPVLDTESIVQQKKEVMLTLSDIELTQSLQKDKGEKDIHPLLEKHQMLDCALELISKKSAEFKLLEQYSKACKDTRKGPLLDIWRIDRKGESVRFQKHDDIKHRKLLWHGTNVAVVAAILKAGLRIMPHSGGLVGRGIYFASEHAKSSWYVCPHFGEFEGENNVGFMFLVEVALGKEKSIQQCDGSITQAPPGFDSVVARGNSEPDPKKDKKTVLDGKEVIVPVGPPVPQKAWAKSSFCQMTAITEFLGMLRRDSRYCREAQRRKAAQVQGKYTQYIQELV
ncbi:hypothetical protein O3P69_016955 [Scylla paramamosain]|uniref:Poly [ADP-ribose] polymerase n=1 Tax=Scylla paramamosain TaxID=85552 RepID=A0AAW0TTD2_SCYPA